MSRMEKPWTITGDPAAKRGAYADGLNSRSLPKAFKTLAGLVDQFAALEAARLTSSAEPDALTPVVMSGGAEPAGAAKHLLGWAVVSWDEVKREQRVDTFSGFGGDIYQTREEAEEILGLTRATMALHRPLMHYELAQVLLIEAPRD